jgi:hypothetical protein
VRAQKCLQCSVDALEGRLPTGQCTENEAFPGSERKDFFVGVVEPVVVSAIFLWVAFRIATHRSL